MGMKNFLEQLERQSMESPLFEESDAMSVIQGSSGDWWYVPKDAYFNDLVRVAIHEVGEDDWEIYYCAMGSRSAAANPGAEEVEFESINSVLYGDNNLNEEIEGDQAALKGWVVKSKWAGDFGECLKRCVAVVQGDSASSGVGDINSFKQEA